MDNLESIPSPRLSVTPSRSSRIALFPGTFDPFISGTSRWYGADLELVDEL